MPISQMKESMLRRFWTYPTHYIIAKNGSREKVKEINLRAGGTRNEEYNQQAIQIELIWNFNIVSPSESQYKTLRYLISEIEKKHPWMKIIWHNEASPTACPWKNFDFKKIEAKSIEFSLSRYYSVQPNQRRYYNWKTYEADFKMNCHWNCLKTANWTKLNNSMRWKTVACPVEYKLWTKIWLDWVWIVTCNDRGWAIKGNKIDMYCWVGDWALDNRKNCPTGERMWYIVE